jgi:3'(2'), 5'-bisphosphate nucleotidase
LEEVTALVRRAGEAVMEVYACAFDVESKVDGSPVTEADRRAEEIILRGLDRVAPGVPAISEEAACAQGYGQTTAQDGDGAEPSVFWLVDPLDGTKEFIAGRGEFTVNLALVTDGVPLLGIICAPAIDLLWRGLVGRGAERLSIGEAAITAIEPIRTRPMPKAGERWVAAVSRSHGDVRTEAFIQSRPGAVRLPLGSAVKFGRLAEGAADIYPRLAPTSEWDIAAGQAVVTAAGGKVTDETGAPLRFGERRDSFIVPAFVAWGDPAQATTVLA